MGPIGLPGQATTLPYAFHTVPLQDSANGAGNMDTGASSHLNDSITRLSDVFNTCIYLSVSVGDNHTIPVTNTGHSILPTPYSQHTWHQRLGYPRSEVLHCLVSRNLISCNKEKPLVLCHTCQLDKHMRLPFVSSNTSVTYRFDIVHSNVWTSSIPSLSGKMIENGAKTGIYGFVSIKSA
ncbi:ribonuclease H-like domain-containing protein [Tanacetum coccineum]